MTTKKTWLCGRCKLGTVEVNYHDDVVVPCAPDGRCAVCEAREHWKSMPESTDLHHMGAQMRDALVKLRVALSDVAPERAPLTEALATFARETYAEAQDVINDWDKLNGGPPLATSRMRPDEKARSRRTEALNEAARLGRSIRERVNDRAPRETDDLVWALIDVLDEERE